MQRKTIQITVEGSSGSGKTTIAEMLDMLLAKEGWDTDLERLYPDEHGPHREIQFCKRLDAVKRTVKITINERQKTRLQSK